MEFEKKLTTDDILELVNKLSKNYQDIIPTSEIKKYPGLDWGKNGVGDRFARKKFNYTSVYNTKIKLYSEERVSDWVHQQLLIRWVDSRKDKIWDAYLIKSHMNNGVEIYIYDIQEILFYKGNIMGKKSGDKIQVKLTIKNHKIQIV